ncbi:hypothetical protein NEUTE1DRAFT_116004 [Neurospora tetrasperma FGSC 2508]|uniref:Uncharacterized protein n=1 Tax=Neurospora tetrasperma (strain FGSC 2508 / ATCC MYA-4615 / P0657) TaxID=510951 RepID=F8MBP1_NEUT8|nr:uncharacterized protein NEUTE1DRAFT_116004 [Neurospora tetrasperma FGSC 2508]EGO61153.1 hypothetical protein NEUTE1DRAFT_116004 [Neurospora tetrasperma FGSC 2508]EGZ74843.1 hypothetical protein NEUTE2DRAFT_143479 [Neurospora tetrasperma FGSC 2509]
MGPNKTLEMPPSGASLPIVDVEKAASEDARTRSTRPEDQRLPTNTTTDNKMNSSRRALLSVTLCLLFFFGLTSAGPSKWQQRVQCREGAASAEGENLQSLLDAASKDSLHNILHKAFPGRFQHGVWESEKQAIEAVHRDNAPLATAVLRMAKRDDSNTTIASSTQQPTSSASSSAQATSSSSSAQQVTTSSSSSSVPAPEPSTTTQVPPVTITTTSTTSTTSTISTTSTTSIKSTSSSAPQASPSSTGTSVSESERTLVLISTSSSASSVSSSEPSSEAGVSSTTSSSSVSSTTLSTTSKAKPQTTEQPQTTQQPQQPNEPMTPSSKVIVQTLTSTSDGVEVIVTQTSTVRVDLTPTVGAGTTRASPSLQTENAASSLQQQPGSGRWLMVVEAVVLGALLFGFALA